jgi:hypothetical protein
VTAATVTLTPGPGNGPGAGASADDNYTAPRARDDFERWRQELSDTGRCHHPVQVKGSIRAVDLATGEVRPVYSTADEPGGVLLLPCGNRREAVCPTCSQTYKRDARQLVRAGLTGGKGIPETIATHPCAFATFTAPSFGPVHARRMRGKTVLPCRPRRDANARRCPHARDISCPVRHNDNDPRLGRALCADCYDYTAAVLFNAHAGELWRRFTTYLPRHLARRLHITQKQLRDVARIRYVKVAEYQARGVVHFHAVIRLDAPGDDHRPPPPGLATYMLCDAIRAAAAAAAITVAPGSDHPHSPAMTLRFGAQIDLRPIREDTTVGLPGTGEKLSVEAVGNYIAKYVTKSLTVPGLPDRRFKIRADITALRCPRHYRQMMTASWDLGAGEVTGDPRLRKWAHVLGYGGHCLTKSRAYSVTFGQLRRERREYRRRLRHPDGEQDPWGRPLDETIVLILQSWTYVGTGYTATATADAEMAFASAARARDHDQADRAA